MQNLATSLPTVQHDDFCSVDLSLTDVPRGVTTRKSAGLVLNTLNHNHPSCSSPRYPKDSVSVAFFLHPLLQTHSELLGRAESGFES